MVSFFENLGKELRKKSNKYKFNINIPTLTVTRWNSMFIMLQAVDNQKNILFEYFDNKMKKKKLGFECDESLLQYCNKNAVEYKVLKKLIDILNPFLSINNFFWRVGVLPVEWLS